MLYRIPFQSTTSPMAQPTTAMRPASSRRSAARDRPHEAALLRARLPTPSHRRLPSPTPAAFTALRRLPQPRGHRPAASQPAVERTWSPAALGLDDSARLPEDSNEDARSGSGSGRRCRPPVRRVGAGHHVDGVSGLGIDEIDAHPLPVVNRPRPGSGPTH
jgi:hypothetical protein